MINIDFDNIIHDLTRLQSMLVIVALNIFGAMISTTGNQVLIFCTYLGSAVYIWLKVKREFFNNTKKQDKP